MAGGIVISTEVLFCSNRRIFSIQARSTTDGSARLPYRLLHVGQHTTRPGECEEVLISVLSTHMRSRLWL